MCGIIPSSILPHEALDCIHWIAGVNHPDHSYTRKSHIGKDLEISGSSHLVKDCIVRSNQEKNF